MTKRVNVSQSRIQRNVDLPPEERLPPIRVRLDDGTDVYAWDVEIRGPSRLVYRPDEPLQGGARLWLETEAELGVDGWKRTVPACE